LHVCFSGGGFNQSNRFARRAPCGALGDRAMEWILESGGR
jgi:hypothetical protein